MSDDNRRLRIMIVDDSATLRALLHRTLKNIDRSLDLAEFDNGDAALDYYKPDKVDLVLLDINMPGKDGIEVLEALKVSNPDCFVVMVTANRTNEWVIKAKQLGANGYIAKPFSADKLHKVLDDCMRYRLLKAHAAEERRVGA